MGLNQDMAGLFVPTDLLDDPLALGFKDLRAGGNLNEDSGVLVADLTQPESIELADRRLSPPPSWKPLVCINFPEPHPQQWKRLCLQFGLLLLLTHREECRLKEDDKDWLAGGLWATAPLAIRSTDLGLLTIQ